MNSYFSFCPKSCTSTTTVATKRLSGDSDKAKEYQKGQKMVIFNFNPSVKVLRSVEKIPLVSLLNDFGSSMGLWLGASVFSIYDMANNFALEIKVGEKWKILPNVIVILVSLFPVGIGCLFVYLTQIH